MEPLQPPEQEDSGPSWNTETDDLAEFRAEQSRQRKRRAWIGLGIFGLGALGGWYGHKLFGADCDDGEVNMAGQIVGQDMPEYNAKNAIDVPPELAGKGAFHAGPVKDFDFVKHEKPDVQHDLIGPLNVSYGDNSYEFKFTPPDDGRFAPPNKPLEKVVGDINFEKPWHKGGEGHHLELWAEGQRNHPLNDNLRDFVLEANEYEANGVPENFAVVDLDAKGNIKASYMVSFDDIPVQEPANENITPPVHQENQTPDDAQKEVPPAPDAHDEYVTPDQPMKDDAQPSSDLEKAVAAKPVKDQPATVVANDHTPDNTPAQSSAYEKNSGDFNVFVGAVNQEYVGNFPDGQDRIDLDGVRYGAEYQNDNLFVSGYVDDLSGERAFGSGYARGYEDVDGFAAQLDVKARTPNDGMGVYGEVNVGVDELDMPSGNWENQDVRGEVGLMWGGLRDNQNRLEIGIFDAMQENELHNVHFPNGAIGPVNYDLDFRGVDLGGNLALGDRFHLGGGVEYYPQIQGPNLLEDGDGHKIYGNLGYEGKRFGAELQVQREDLNLNWGAPFNTPQDTGKESIFFGLNIKF